MPRLPHMPPHILTRFRIFLMPVHLLFISCIFTMQTSVAAADIDDYEVTWQRMKILEALDNREEKKAGYDAIIADFRDNGNPRLQYLVARAMRQRAVAEYDPENMEDSGEERVIVKLDEMISKYKESERDDIKIEVIAAMQNKASVYSRSSKLANEKLEGKIYDEIIAAVGDASDKSMQRMAAYAMSRKQYCVSWDDGTNMLVLRNLIQRFSSSDDPYVRKIVVESLKGLARKVPTEEEKNVILEKILTGYQSDEDADIQDIVAEARDNLTPEDGYDAGAVNSFGFFSTGKIESALRQAWRCKNPMEKYALYSDAIKKYRHMKHEEQKLGLITALIERSFIDMSGENDAVLAYFDDFAAKAPDYGSWLLVCQNRLWFVRGRENILAELDTFLDPVQKSRFDPDESARFLLDTVSSQKIEAMIDWARQLKFKLSQPEKLSMPGRAAAEESGEDAPAPRGEDKSSGDSDAIPSMLDGIFNEYGDTHDRVAQYNISRAMERQAALLDDETLQRQFWRCVVERLKPERSVYARHHVIAGYAKLIAMADGEEKSALVSELVDRFDNDGTFQELLLLDDIRAGKADFPMPLLFRDW